MVEYKRKRPSSAEIVASLRQTDSASERCQAITNFGKAIRKDGLFQSAWEAIGGAQGLARTMSEFSVQDVEFMCIRLGHSSGAIGSVAERRAALGDLVRILWDTPYDVRPLHHYYQNIVPACEYEVFKEFEARPEIDWGWSHSQKKRALCAYRNEFQREFLRDLVSLDFGRVSFKDNLVLFHGDPGFREKVLSAVATYGWVLHEDFMDSFAMPILNRLARHGARDPSSRNRLRDLVIDCVAKHASDLKDGLHLEPKGLIHRHLVQPYRVGDLSMESRLTRILVASPRQDSLKALFQLAMTPGKKQAGKQRNSGNDAKNRYDPYPLFRLLVMHRRDFPVDISNDSDANIERLRRICTASDSWPLEMFTSTEPRNALALLNRLAKADHMSSFIQVPGSNRTVLHQNGEYDGVHADVEVLRAMLQSRLWGTDDARSQRIRDIIEKRKKMAETAREAPKRAFWAKSTLNLCVAMGDLDTLEEAFVWARRFAKDSQTLRGLYVGHGHGILTDELDRLLSCVPLEDDQVGRLTSRSIAKNIATANRIAVELARIVATAASEPEFNVHAWLKLLLVPRTMVQLRADGAATLLKIIGDETDTNETLLPPGKWAAEMCNQLLSRMAPKHFADLASFTLDTMKTRLSHEMLLTMMTDIVSIAVSVTRTDQPTLACPFICEAIINDDGENSSWHRQLFTVKFLSSLPAKAAREFLHSIADGIVDIMREQNACPRRPDAELDPNARHVKVTTIKMVAQALHGNVYIDSLSSANILISLLREANHIDARITLVASLISVLREPTCTPSISQLILGALEASIVPVISRVNERFPVADNEWEGVPEVGNESPLLTMLIWKGGSNLMPIITEGIVQSAKHNELWMRAFLARNNFVVDSLPVCPVRPAILGSIMEKFIAFPASLFHMMKSFVLASLNPPADVARVTKQVKADPELAASNAGLHWLRIFDDSPGRVFHFGLSEAVNTYLRTYELKGCHISDSELREFIIEAAESMVRLGQTGQLSSLVGKLNFNRRHSGEHHLDVFNRKAVPIIKHIIAFAEGLRDAPDRPSVLPNTFHLRTILLPIPFSNNFWTTRSKEEPSHIQALDKLASDLSAHIEELARDRFPYHRDFRELKWRLLEDLLEDMDGDDLAYVAVSLAAIDDAVDVRNPALAVYLRLELVAAFLLGASDPGEEVAGRVRALVRLWKTCKAEGLRVMGQELDNSLLKKGLTMSWYTSTSE
ncbi:hypothetical protein F5X68DRAFT_249078 [Plectosphaerella plurivora]|uniref:Uncharacterized protein n=1 Tax=Plectosphaerella plurivora TaxID=936078 RepID=A0A9P8V2Y9_9PEZI|nr:hypothetical protein F5X68DRAFT_249078 [Plectosphaerella plurivora]